MQSNFVFNLDTNFQIFIEIKQIQSNECFLCACPSFPNNKFCKFVKNDIP